MSADFDIDDPNDPVPNAKAAIKAGLCANPYCRAVFDAPALPPSPAPIDFARRHLCANCRAWGMSVLSRGLDITLLYGWPKCRRCREWIEPERFYDMLDTGFEVGDYVYCARHQIIHGRDPELVALQGLDEAQALIHIDDRKLVRWPMRTLHRMTGPLVPGRVTYGCAMSGGGKTTFIRNCIWPWVNADNLRVRYLPLESSLGETLAGFAAFMAGVSPDDALSFRLRDWANAGDEASRIALEELTLAFEHLRRDKSFLSRLQIEPIDELTPKAFDRAIEATAALGADILIVDHVDHTENDANDYSPEIQVSNQVQMKALRAAKQLNIPVLLLTQINSNRLPTDKVQWLRPPSINWLYNKGKKEQNAALFVGFHRVLNPAVTKEQLRAVRGGELDYLQVSMPNVMGVSDMKARFGRGTTERTILLDLVKGKLTARHGNDFDRFAGRSALDALPEVDLLRHVDAQPARPDSTLWMDT